VNSQKTGTLQLAKDPEDKDPFHKKQQQAASLSEDQKRMSTDIPAGVAAFLKLTRRDKVEWRTDIIEGERVAIVNKQKKEGSE
jgi:hypothetical protein